MKLVEAAEAGYAAANSYFLLLWGIVAVVGLTTFFEQREISKEQSEAARIIQLYDELIAPTEATASALSRVVSAGPPLCSTASKKEWCRKGKLGVK